jgi:hypothetical protein
MIVNNDPNHMLLIAIRDELTDNTRKTNQILQAFPAGDIDGHRRYHESVIEWRELRNKMVREALIHAAKASTLGALGWLAYAVWQSVKISIKQ